MLVTKFIVTHFRFNIAISLNGIMVTLQVHSNHENTTVQWYVPFLKMTFGKLYFMHSNSNKGISRGPEAVQSHQNDSCYKSVLCFIL